MLKIKRIEIENFRGIKSPVSLDFKKGSNLTSVLLYGRNGTGKSSFVDAWEWLNRDFVIKHLDKEGVTAKDYPHHSCKGQNCCVTVEFEHPEIKSVSAKFNKAKPKTPEISGEYLEFRKLSSYPNFLRSADLHEFVYLTKTKKYEYIAKFFGMEEFTNKQGFLRTALTRIEKLLESQRSLGKANIQDLEGITGHKTNDEAAVLEIVNGIADKHSLPHANNFCDLDQLRTELSTLVTNNPVAQSLSEWRSFKNRLQNYFQFEEVVNSAKAFNKALVTLHQDEANFAKLLLLDLYNKSIEKLTNIEDRSRCPVCDQSFDGDLLGHIRAKHAQLAALQAVKNEYETKKSDIERRIKLIIPKCREILNEPSTDIRAELKHFFDLNSEINGQLQSILSTLATHPPGWNGFEDLTPFEKIDELCGLQSHVDQAVGSRISDLSSDEKTSMLALDYELVGKVQKGYTDLAKNKAKFRYLLKLQHRMERLFRSLTSYIQNEIGATFASIESEVMDCFGVLESESKQFRNPRVRLVEGKDKAVELEIEFMDEKVTPAFKFMSESQINSFGLSIFLAAVKHFNPDFKFIILDDVINSLDDYKRPRLPSLLASKFGDFQILLLTHDQIFFDTMQRAFPEWQRYRFTQWDYHSGPKFSLAKNYLEEVKSYLDDDNARVAGQTLGRYLEWVFGSLNENLKTPIPYRSSNNHTLADFYNPLVARLRKKLKRTDHSHQLIEVFDALDQGDIFRNYCSHWKNESTPFSTPEIKSIFEKWLQIEELIFCKPCKSFIQLNEMGNKEYVRCNCAQLDLQNEAYYLVSVN